MQVKFAALVPWLRRALPNLRCTYNTHRFEVIVLKVCLGNRHLCLWKKKKKQSRDRKNENQKGRKMEQWGTGMGKKERTAWKGGKQFHANKGWTIGELSVSPPLPLCRSAALSSLRARAELFDRDKAVRGLGFFFVFFFFFCRLLNALWSIPKRLILFRERFPISLMLFNNSSSLFYGLVPALEGLPKPGCIWIIIIVIFSIQSTASTVQWVLEIDMKKKTEFRHQACNTKSMHTPGWAGDREKLKRC